MKGFNDWLKKIDPDGKWTTKQAEDAKAIYKAGWDAATVTDEDRIVVPLSDVEKIMAYFNEATGRTLTVTPSYRDKISSRIREGYTIEQLCHVVDYVVQDWTGKMFGDTPAENYIRPMTIWQSSEKMDKYLLCWEMMQENKASGETVIKIDNAAKPSF